MNNPPKTFPVSISSARELGESYQGTQGVLILSFSADNYAITTWGKTRRLCQLMEKAGEQLDDKVMKGIFTAGLIRGLRGE